eukprot:scaffold17617_cov98-Isochrysis_galbana.AAC.2
MNGVTTCPRPPEHKSDAQRRGGAERRGLPCAKEGHSVGLRARCTSLHSIAPDKWNLKGETGTYSSARTRGNRARLYPRPYVRSAVRLVDVRHHHRLAHRPVLHQQRRRVFGAAGNQLLGRGMGGKGGWRESAPGKGKGREGGLAGISSWEGEWAGKRVGGLGGGLAGWKDGGGWREGGHTGIRGGFWSAIASDRCAPRCGMKKDKQDRTCPENKNERTGTCRNQIKQRQTNQRGRKKEPTSGRLPRRWEMHQRAHLQQPVLANASVSSDAPPRLRLRCDDEDAAAVGAGGRLEHAREGRLLDGCVVAGQPLGGVC